MNHAYQARWISKERRNTIRKSGAVGQSILVDSLNGFLIVEPLGSERGDGDVLTPDEADYELRDVWCLDSRAKLGEARRRLHLAPELASTTLLAIS